MSYVKILIHSVWGTKNREPILTRDKRTILFNHILENTKGKNIYLDTIGGYTDHIHCIISLGSEQSIAKVIQLMKGESSFWSNQEKLFPYKFGWAEDYYANSFNERDLDSVRKYILNQEEHHKVVSFKDEYESLVGKRGGIN